MTDTSGRARADAAREAAERAAAVAAMLQEAEEKGWVAVGRDAVDYVPPDDKTLTEVVVGAHEWARYTARVKGGGVYQEGGARRVLWTTDKKARKLLADKAAALPKETSLFALVETWKRARGTRGEGLTVHAVLWADDALRGALEERIRERATADDEAGRLRSREHAEILAELGVDDEGLRRLRGDRTVRPEEARAAAEAANGAPEPTPEAVLDEAIVAARGRKDAVVLEGADAPYVDRSDPDATLVVEAPDDDWAYVAVLNGGDVHFEAGLRRERVTTEETAASIVAERVEALLSGDDLRDLLWLRRVLDRANGAFSAEARIAADPALRARLDEAIRTAAVGYEAVPLFGIEQAGELRQAGVAPDALRTLVDPRALAALTASEQAAKAPAYTAWRPPSVTTVRAATAAREAKGYLWLAEDVVPYVAARDERVAERLAARPDWCTHAVLLDDDSVHLEGGRVRKRLTPEKLVRPLLKQAADAIIDRGDLYDLLAVASVLDVGPAATSPAAVVAADPKRREALRKRAVELMEDERYTNHVVQRIHREGLVVLGVDDETVARLVRK